MYCSRCGTWAPDVAAVCSMCGTAFQKPADAALATVPDAVAAAHAGMAAAAPMHLAAAVHYAGFWRRLAALLLDTAVMYFPYAIARALLGLPLYSFNGDADTHLAFRVDACFYAATWLYSALQESSRAQGTLGQRTLGLRVTDTAGRRIGFARASGRYFAHVLTLCTCSLGYLFNLWTARRQTLHDLASGCVIIVAPAAGAAPAEPVAIGRSE